MGSSATVYRARWTRPGHPPLEVAVKVLSAKELNAKELIQEMTTLASLSDASNCVVALFGVVVQGSTAIVMEMCERGSLYHVLMQDSLEIGWKLGLSFMQDAAAGLRLLHSRNIVHRDVK